MSEPVVPPKPKSKGGRKKIPVDMKLLEKLAKLHLSQQVIADCLGISVDTLDRRFAADIKIWQSKSKGKIAESLFDEGVNKRQPWALKMLAQRQLNYADKVEQVSTVRVSEVDDLTEEEALAQLEAIRKQNGQS